MELTNEYHFLFVWTTTAIFVILSVVGYTWLFSVVHKHDRLRKTKTWLKSLAASDLLFQIHAMMTVVAAYQRSWPFGDIGYKVHAFLGLSMGLNTIGSYAFLLIDTVHEVANVKLVNLSRRSGLLLVWISGIAVSLSYAFFIATFDISPNTIACLINLHDRSILARLYIIGISFAWFAVPMYYMIKSCSILQSRIKHIHAMPLLYMACYSIFAACSLLTVTIGLDRWIYNHPFVHILPKAFGAVNPFLQLYLSGEIGGVATCGKRS